MKILEYGNWNWTVCSILYSAQGIWGCYHQLVLLALGLWPLRAIYRYTELGNVLIQENQTAFI